MNPSRTKFIFFIFLFIISPQLVSDAYAEEKRLQCRIQYEAEKKDLFVKLHDLEQSYSDYRWFESKIRWLYYERIWKARFDAEDPYSKQTRKEGRGAAKKLYRDLKHYETLSKEASNRYHALTEEILHVGMRYLACCEDKNFERCIYVALQPLYDLMTEADKYFGHIFEHEREYRKAVSETAAGPKGLYPRDALEISDAHEDFFWRFESSRSNKRFLDDAKMMDYFHQAYQLMEWDQIGDGCCYECDRATFNTKKVYAPAH